MEIRCRLEEGEAMELWDAALTDGVLGQVFSNGLPTWDNFKSVMEGADVFGGVYVDGSPAGFFYLSDDYPEKDSVDIHFGLFRDFLPERWKIGRAALDWVFKTTGRKYIFGVIPIRYEGSCRFALEMGFEELGLIDELCYIHRLNRLVGGRLFLLKRKDFYCGKDIQNA